MLIYVAGPYTGSNREEVEHNVNRAIDAGIAVFSKGHFPYIPHLTDMVDKRAKELGKPMSWGDFMLWDSQWLAVCDALLFLAESPGATIELQAAKNAEKIIYYSIDDIPESGDLTS